jgi:hypothetical protein
MPGRITVPSPITVEDVIDRYKLEPGAATYQVVKNYAIDVATTHGRCYAVFFLNHRGTGVGTFAASLAEDAYTRNREIVAIAYPGGYELWQVGEVQS